MSQADQLELTSTKPALDNLRALLDEAMAERNRLHNAWFRARDKVHKLRYEYRLAKERERRRAKQLAREARKTDSWQLL